MGRRPHFMGGKITILLVPIFGESSLSGRSMVFLRQNGETVPRETAESWIFVRTAWDHNRLRNISRERMLTKYVEYDICVALMNFPSLGDKHLT
eukprot:s1955_g11.t1